MKLKLITLLMAFAMPAAFADCGGCKHEDKDKDKKEETVSVVDCGKDHEKKKECGKDCEKECCKKESTVIADGDCKKECPEECEKEEATAIAHCGGCKHDDKKEEKKEEETLVAEGDCKKGGCGSKEESTVLA